jgi:hypothetical protein
MFTGCGYQTMNFETLITNFQDVALHNLYPLLHPVEQFALSLAVRGAPRPTSAMITSIAQGAVVVSYLGALTTGESNMLPGLSDASRVRFERWVRQYPEYSERPCVLDTHAAFYGITVGVIRTWRGLLASNMSDNRKVVEVIPTAYAKYTYRFQVMEYIPDIIAEWSSKYVKYVPGFSEEFAIALLTRSGGTNRNSFSHADILTHTKHWKACIDAMVASGRLTADSHFIHAALSRPMPYETIEYILERAPIQLGVIQTIFHSCRDDNVIRRLYAVVARVNPAVCLVNQHFTRNYQHYDVLFELIPEDTAIALIILNGHDTMVKAFIRVKGLNRFLELSNNMPRIRNSAMSMIDVDSIDYTVLSKTAANVVMAVKLDRDDILRRLVQLANYKPTRKVLDTAIKHNSTMCLAYLLQLRDWKIVMSDYATAFLHRSTMQLLQAYLGED